MSEKSLPEIYAEMIDNAIDEGGVYPHQAVLRGTDGGLRICALAVNVPELIKHFWNTVGSVEEAIYGIDMTTRSGQGTHYADALVLAHWTRAPGRNLTDPDCLKVGVINYQNTPRLVDPIDWHNSHWDHWVRAVFPSYLPPFLIRVESA